MAEVNDTPAVEPDRIAESSVTAAARNTARQALKLTRPTEVPALTEGEEEPDYDFSRPCSCWSGSYPEKDCPAHEYLFNPRLASWKSRTEEKGVVRRFINSHPEIFDKVRAEERERLLKELADTKEPELLKFSRDDEAGRVVNLGWRWEVRILRGGEYATKPFRFAHETNMRKFVMSLVSTLALSEGYKYDVAVGNWDFIKEDAISVEGKRT